MSYTTYSAALCGPCIKPCYSGSQGYHDRTALPSVAHKTRAIGLGQELDLQCACDRGRVVPPFVLLVVLRRSTTRTCDEEKAYCRLEHLSILKYCVCILIGRLSNISNIAFEPKWNMGCSSSTTGIAEKENANCYLYHLILLNHYIYNIN